MVAFVVLCERTTTIFTSHSLFVIVCLLPGQRNHVDIASNYSTDFSCFLHNVIVKFDHGIWTAVDERRCLVFCMMRDAIRAETRHNVFVYDREPAAVVRLCAIYRCQKRLEVRYNVKRHRMLFLHRFKL